MLLPVSGMSDLRELAQRDLLEEGVPDPPDPSLLARDQLASLVIGKYLSGQPIEDTEPGIRDGIASSCGISIGKARWIISQHQRIIKVEQARTLRALTRAQEESLLEAREELVGEAVPSIRKLAEIRDSAPADVAARAAIALLDRAGVTPKVGETIVNPALNELPEREDTVPLSALSELRRMVEAFAAPVPQAQIPAVPSRILSVTATLESDEEAPSND